MLPSLLSSSSVSYGLSLVQSLFCSTCLDRWGIPDKWKKNFLSPHLAMTNMERETRNPPRIMNSQTAVESGERKANRLTDLAGARTNRRPMPEVRYNKFSKETLEIIPLGCGKPGVSA